MDDKAAILDPQLPAMPPWGWPQAIWWVCLTVFIMAALWRIRRRRQRQHKRQPVMQLIMALQSDLNIDSAQTIAQASKQCLLAFCPRDDVASLSVADGLIYLAKHWQLPAVHNLAEALTQLCYARTLPTHIADASAEIAPLIAGLNKVMRRIE